MFPKWKTYSSSWILLTFAIYLIEIHKGISKGTWRKTIYFKPYWDDWKGDSITALVFLPPRVLTVTSLLLFISTLRFHRVLLFKDIILSLIGYITLPILAKKDWAKSWFSTSYGDSHRKELLCIWFLSLNHGTRWHFLRVWCKTQKILPHFANKSAYFIWKASQHSCSSLCFTDDFGWIKKD